VTGESSVIRITVEALAARATGRHAMWLAVLLFSNGIAMASRGAGSIGGAFGRSTGKEGGAQRARSALAAAKRVSVVTKGIGAATRRSIAGAAKPVAVPRAVEKLTVAEKDAGILKPRAQLAAQGSSSVEPFTSTAPSAGSGVAAAGVPRVRGKSAAGRDTLNNVRRGETVEVKPQAKYRDGTPVEKFKRICKLGERIRDGEVTLYQIKTDSSLFDVSYTKMYEYTRPLGPQKVPRWQYARDQQNKVRLPRAGAPTVLPEHVEKRLVVRMADYARRRHHMLEEELASLVRETAIELKLVVKTKGKPYDNTTNVDALVAGVLRRRGASRWWTRDIQNVSKFTGVSKFT